MSAIDQAGPTDNAEQAPPDVRTAKDASDDKRLQRDPGDEDAKLDVALDETFPTSDASRLRHDPGHQDAKLDIALDESFPTSDAPSNTQPGKGKDPAPSSGYDEEAERERMAGKE
jgi:hypothetical protein